MTNFSVILRNRHAAQTGGMCSADENYLNSWLVTLPWGLLKCLVCPSQEQYDRSQTRDNIGCILSQMTRPASLVFNHQTASNVLKLSYSRHLTPMLKCTHIILFHMAVLLFDATHLLLLLQSSFLFFDQWIFCWVDFEKTFFATE